MATNIQTITEAFNLFTVENLPPTHKFYYESTYLGGYRYRQDMKEGEAYETLGFKLYLECSKDTNYNGETTYYIEHSYWIKESNNGTLCMLMRYKNKYYLHPFYGYERGLTYEQKQAFFKAPKEPNKIGVFSEKKLNDWVEYCDAYVQALNEAKETAQCKLIAGQIEINEFISNVGKCEVTTYNKTTWVKTGLFEVRFVLHESGYLEKNITFKGGLNDIVDLLK